MCKRIPTASFDDAIAAFNRGAYRGRARCLETGVAQRPATTHDWKPLIVAFNEIDAALHCASNAAAGSVDQPDVAGDDRADDLRSARAAD